MSDLTLNKEIYTYRAVMNAVRAYHRMAKITVADSQNQWIIHFDNCVYDERLTSHEFENYVLCLEATVGMKDADM